jgi:hypothetical protein
VGRSATAFRQTLFTSDFFQEEQLSRVFSTWAPIDEEGNKRERPVAVTSFEGPGAPECQAQAREYLAMVPADSTADANKALGRPRFSIDVLEVVRDAPAPSPSKGKRATAARPVLVEAESSAHDSTDPNHKPEQYTYAHIEEGRVQGGWSHLADPPRRRWEGTASREEMDSVLFVRDVRSACTLDANVLKVRTAAMHALPAAAAWLTLLGCHARIGTGPPGAVV